ncbi:MAG: RluA family pseudouridine synthase [Acidimicrobiales bacterium]
MTDGDLEAEVPALLDGVRTDRVVAFLAGVSRSRAAELVAGGKVRLDGRPVTSGSVMVTSGSVLCVATARVEVRELSGDDSVQFTVVHHDDAIVVVDKPPGLVVHPGAGLTEGTLVSGLAARYPDLLTEVGVGDPGRPGIVHRLDRGTSGLLVVARTAAAFRSLVAQFSSRTVERRYTALVAGHVTEDQGVVDAPIGRSTRTPTLMTVSADGRPALTRYTVLHRYTELGGVSTSVDTTLLSVRLDTGRTHQIRVHMAAIGYPVVGDRRYAPSARRRPGGKRADPPALAPGVLEPGRLFLHAGELGFDHPVTGTPVHWSSPLPPDLARLLDPWPP